MNEYMKNTQEFIQYIELQNLTSWGKAWEDKNGVNAIVTTQPNPSSFTQVRKIDRSRWHVRLSKKDFANTLIITH